MLCIKFNVPNIIHMPKLNILIQTEYNVKLLVFWLFYIRNKTVIPTHNLYKNDLINIIAFHETIHFYLYL